MKRILLSLLCFVCLLSCASCSLKYYNSYKALMFVRSEMRDHATVSFSSFEGTYVIKLKMSGKDQEGDIHCKASLEEGELNVYYDAFGTKELLFNLKAGESIDERLGYIESGKRVYIIIETVSPAKDGRISVDCRKQ